MASPTRAELENQIQLAVAAIWNQYNQQTAVADADAFVAAIESDLQEALSRGARNFQAGVNASVLGGRALLAATLLSYVYHEVGDPADGVQEALDLMYDHFQANDYTVTSRGFTYGSPAAGAGNAGTGSVLRLTVDENGHDLENAFPAQSFEIKCVRDAQTGANEHEEQFRFRTSKSTLAYKSVLDLTNGAGLRTSNLSGISSNQSRLGNPTFSQYSWTTAPTTGSPQTGVSGDSLTNWTVGTSITNFQLDVDEFSHDVVGDTTPTSVRLLDNDSLTQKLSVRNVQINPNLPYYLEVWVKPESSCDGTFTIYLGATSKATTVTGLSAGAWNRVRLDLDKNLWPAQWNEQDADVKLELTSRTTGTLLLDEVRLVPMVGLAGTYYTVSSGLTPFLLDDVFTHSDSVASDSKIQFLLWLLLGRFLPHTADATQVTAAGGRTLTFADDNPDTITASSGDFTSDGYKAGMLLTVAGTSNNDGTYVIGSVTALVITLDAAETLTAEGPLSATATLDATASLIDPS